MINKFNIFCKYIKKVAKTQAIVLFFQSFRYKTTKILAQIEQNSPMFQTKRHHVPIHRTVCRLRHG